MREEIHEVKVKDIKVSQFNVRHMDVRKDLDDLAKSIKKHGLIQPVILMGEPYNPPYRLIVGQRRFLAHKKLQKRTIRAVFVGDIDSVKASIMSLSENMQRSELNHADAAKAITELYKKFGRDERRVAQEIGMSLFRVRRYIYIQERASDKTKRKLRARKVSPADVKRALDASGGKAEKADELLTLMKEYELTKYQKKRVVEYGTAHPQATAKKIVTEAQQPRVERHMMVTLPDNIRRGLEKASKELALSPEDVASQAIEDWLWSKGFIK